MAYDPGEGGGVDTPFVPYYLPEGKPVIEYVRIYSALSPFGLHFEFRPLGFENWTESAEGDTTIDVLIDEATMSRFSEIYDGPYSKIISLIASGKIKRRLDRHVAGGGTSWSSFVYDSYYVQQVRQEPNSRIYRMVCVGAKEYLSKRLAIPTGMNTTDGTVTVPDGSQAAKPIPSSQILSFTNKTQKGIIAGLIAETATLQALPIQYNSNDLAGTMARTYLFKDFRSIKEAIDNLIDDQGGQDVVFDGGRGTRDNVLFQFTTGGTLERGIPTVDLNSRNSEIFVPAVELAKADSVNNIWAVGNATDGNILLAHKVQAGTTGKILLQTANTERNDIQTPAFLLQYAMGILERSGSYVRTMALTSGLTPKMFLAYTGNYLYIQSPEDPDIHETWWLVVNRTIDTAAKKIDFDLEEWVMDNNGNGIPDRLE